MNKETLIAYVLPVLAAFVTGMAGYIGAQFKKLYEKYVNTKVKKDVASTCVKAVEQLYHDLGGPEKLRKAQEGIRDMLDEKGIPISDLELNLLIESVVAEFNFGFAKVSEVTVNADHQ
jgi:ribosomal protein L20A (L18A)